MNYSFKFCKVIDLLLYTYAGTLAAAKACLQLSRDREPAGYKKASACFQDVLLLLVGVYAKKIFSPSPQ